MASLWRRIVGLILRRLIALFLVVVLVLTIEIVVLRASLDTSDYYNATLRIGFYLVIQASAQTVENRIPLINQEKTTGPSDR